MSDRKGGDEGEASGVGLLDGGGLMCPKAKGEKRIMQRIIHLFPPPRLISMSFCCRSLMGPGAAPGHLHLHANKVLSDLLPLSHFCTCIFTEWCKHTRGVKIKKGGNYTELQVRQHRAPTWHSFTHCQSLINS